MTPASPGDSATAGGRLGPYRLESRLGRGGMGEVFLAWDERLERRVAVKRIRHDGRVANYRHERFLREARAAARLNHPAIVQVYDIVADGEGEAIVMELVEGRPLTDLLAPGRPLPLAFALPLAREIAEGLEAAHAAGLIHRDLKAGNVMVTPAGHAKILDFGLARPDAPETGEPLTEAGLVLGTCHAMSPEQARGGEVDARSDLFSLGVLLYEMLAGISPFRGATPLDSLRRVVADTPRPLAEIRPDLPPTLAALVHRLLEKSRERRPWSATQVVEALATLAPEASASNGRYAVDDLPTGPLPIPPTLEAIGSAHPSPLPASQSSSGLAPARLRPAARLAAALLAAGAAWTGYLALRPAAPPVRVAVPRPEIVGIAGMPGKAPDERLALAASGVLVSLLGGLSSLEGLAPLDPSQLGGAASPVEMARAAAADEVLQATLERDGDRARLALRRISREDGRVLWNEAFQIPTDPAELRLAGDAVGAYLRRAYPDHPPRPGIPDSAIEAADYAELLEIRRRMDSGQVTAASQLAPMERLAERSPRFLEARLAAARLCLSLYQNRDDGTLLERAWRHAERARGLSPGDPRALTVAFRIALERRRPDEAEELLAAVDRLLPGDPEALLLRAQLAERRGHTAEALVHLRAAVARAPSWKNLFELARLEYREGQVPAARDHFRALLARSPDNLWGLEKLAEMELMLGDVARAEALYRRLIALAPQRAYFTNLGLARALAGRHAEAVAAYRRALEIDPGHSAVLLNLADALSALGREGEAQALYGRVLGDLDRRAAAAPLEPPEQMARAQCLAHLGRSREAVEIVQRTRERYPSHPEVVYLASLVYALVGDRASALANAKAALDSGTEPRWFTLAAFDSLRRDPELQSLLAAARPSPLPSPGGKPH